jgi:hypothetical protein
MAIGRWLGVSHRVGGLLTRTGAVISRTSVKRITNLEKETEEVKEAVKEFDEEVSQQFKEEDLAYDGKKPNPEDWSEYLESDPDFQEEFDNMINKPTAPEADDTFPPDVFNNPSCLNMELAAPRDRDGSKEFTWVTKCLRDKDGNKNPMLDSARMYEVEHLDGHKALLAANAIAENVFAQVDEEGNRHVLFDEIIDHRQTVLKLSDKTLSLLLAPEQSTGEKRRRDVRSSSSGRIEALRGLRSKT